MVISALWISCIFSIYGSIVTKYTTFYTYKWLYEIGSSRMNFTRPTYMKDKVTEFPLNFLVEDSEIKYVFCCNRASSFFKYLWSISSIRPLIFVCQLDVRCFNFVTVVQHRCNIVSNYMFKSIDKIRWYFLFTYIIIGTEWIVKS